MPDGLIREPPFITAALSLDYDDVTAYKLEQLAAKYPETEFLGSGAESIAIANPDNPEDVIAYVYEAKSRAKDPTNLDAQIVYYTHLIWSTLFPHNFPRIRFALSGDKARTVRRRVKKSFEGQRMIDRSKIKFSLIDVKATCTKYNLPLPKIADNTPGNVMISQDGGEYYVDILSSRKNIQLWPEKELLDFMDTISLPEDKRKVVFESERQLRIMTLMRLLMQQNHQPTDADYDTFMTSLKLNTTPEETQKVRKQVERWLTGLEKFKKQPSLA